jgi:hypothetical protein
MRGALRIVRRTGNGYAVPELLLWREGGNFVRRLAKKYKTIGWHFDFYPGYRNDVARLTRVADKAPALQSKRGQQITTPGTSPR